MAVDPADPRLAPFRDVRRGAGDTVVIEGELALQRALEAGAPVTLVACTPAHAARLRLPPGVELVVADAASLSSLAGFDFHRGVLAAMPRPRAQIDERVLERERCTVVVAAGIADPANVGAVVRTAHAFGVDLVVTDTDPWTRKAIRASAGRVFAQPVVHEPRLDRIVALLQRATELVAATGSGSKSVEDYRRPARLGLLLGNEGQGLPPALLEAAHVHLRIPTISLNVAVAAGILLWTLR